MCKSQYDIEVEQQKQRRERKKEKDTLKMLHSHFDLQPPRSPISPTPPEVQMPTFEERAREMANSGLINEYGSMFFESGQGSSSSAPPPPPPPTAETSEPVDTTPPDWAARMSTEIFGYTPPPPPPTFYGGVPPQEGDPVWDKWT